jgi:hypothetical protein
MQRRVAVLLGGEYGAMTSASSAHSTSATTTPGR